MGVGTTGDTATQGRRLVCVHETHGCEEKDEGADAMRQKYPFTSKDCWELFHGTGCTKDEMLAADADLGRWVTVLPGKDVPSCHK